MHRWSTEDILLGAFYIAILYKMEPHLIALSVQTILAITIFVDLCLFIFIFKKRRSGIMHTLLAFHIFGILCWGISIFLLLTHESVMWAHGAFASAVILAVTKFLFSLAFPQNALPRRSIHYGALLLALITFTASFIPGAFFTSIDVIDNYYVVVKNGPLAFLYLAVISYLLISPIFILWRKYRREHHAIHERNQLYYLFVGTTVFFLIGLATNSILPVFFNIYFFNGLGPSFSLILAGFMVYIISHHNFLQIRKALQLSFIYSTLFFLIVSMYAAMITLLSIIVQRLTQTEILISAGITTILGIFTVPYIDHWMRKKTDNFFFKDHYNYADALYRLSETVNKYLSIDDIRSATDLSLKNIFKAETVETRLANHEETFGSVAAPSSDGDITLEAPIVLDGKIIGTIFLGEKRSGETYTKEDKVLMRTFCNQIAAAFEKARLYTEVSNYSKELEKRVAARTEEIRALQQHQSEMMLDISHKLQSPLTIIKNEISVLRKRMPEHDSLSHFEQTVDDISAFIYDLLTLARLEAIPLDTLEDVDLSEHILELVEYFETVAAESNIRITHTIGPNIHVRCDKKKITELITNLVSNAVKYMGDKTKTRTIAVEIKEYGGTVTLSVEDTGIGIDAKDLPHLFDRFYRATKTEDRARGTGLGLAICKRIVEAHKGTIAVKSELGKGTTFTIKLPTT